MLLSPRKNGLDSLNKEVRVFKELRFVAFYRCLLLCVLCPVMSGVGVYILSPHAAGILYPPPFIRPPPLEGYFQGWGVGVYKIRPRMDLQDQGAEVEIPAPWYRIPKWEFQKVLAGVLGHRCWQKWGCWQVVSSLFSQRQPASTYASTPASTPIFNSTRNEPFHKVREGNSFPKSAREPRFSTIFPMRYSEKGHFQGKTHRRGKNSHVAGGRKSGLTN